jgi:D-apionolactonase
MKMLSKRMCLLLGLVAITSTVRAAEPIPLRAGPVTMVFDADNVFLRYIRLGNHEVLRGINAPIRNENWATIAPKVSNLKVSQRDNSFKVTFDVTCQQADVDFRWKGSISGSDNGEIEFAFDGEAHSTFKKNRIGFCVLHGPSAAGQLWVLETVDGKQSKGRFPKFISPHQPAKNLRAITHELAPGIHARVAFEGDIFEMEDQRNWTDASFKTYCTPLEIPYPVELSKGTKVSQTIRISLDSELPGPAAPAAGDKGGRPEASANGSHSGAILTIGNRQLAVPLLGVQMSGEVENLTDKQLNRLKALHLDHLRVDLPLSDESFVKDLRRATHQAKALGVSLQIVLGLGEAPAFESLLKEINALQPPVSYWLVRGGDPGHFAMARSHLATVSRDARIGVTRITNFVDLNRARPEDKSIQAVGFAVNPQIHAFDNASIVETLPIHADAVNSARQFAGDRPLVIGPITLAPQLLDGVDQPGGPPMGGPLPTYVDQRQVEPFTAVWTLGSIKYLADAGAHSATFFETVGWNGIMDADDVSSRPKEFPSRPGEVFPVYQLLREIAEFKGGSVRQVETSDNLAAVGLALHKPGRMRVLVGNLTGQSQTVTLHGFNGKPVSVQVLGAKETHATPELSISLPPYGIARIDRLAD